MPTCKDCLHYRVCKFHIDEETKMTVNECEHFKDRSKFVELPCEIGSKVFVSPDYGEHFHKATLYGRNEKGSFLVFVNDNELTEDEKHIVSSPMIKMFYDCFLKLYSKEEAEQILIERERTHNEI